MQKKLTILGSGSSLGTPTLGCDCPVCRSDNPKDKRTRSGALLEWNGKKILIDAGPDVRLQGVGAQLMTLDGLILTHAHSDHTAGLVDLRMFVFKTKKPIRTLLSKETEEEFMKRHNYISPYFDFSFFDGKEGSLEFLGIPIQYVSYKQEEMDVKGLRFGNFAYITDIKKYEEHHIKALQGVEQLVITGVDENPTNVHMSIYESIAFAEKVGAEKVWFTHISHNLSHDRGNSISPDHMEMAYDGLEITL